MRHSFTRARRKTLVTPELWLVFFFFGITLLMLVSTYGFLSYKSYSYGQKREQSRMHIAQMEKEIAAFDTEIAFINKERTRSEQVFTANTVLKESIKNLFDLVPERITLTQANMQKNALILYGVTPNKDVYEFMLHAPLRSIFHRSYSSFYPLENGWFRFVSTNYLDEEEL